MLVIGNGESRQGIDIDKFTSIKVGCNALMRDFKVEHLICCDRRMVEESIKRGYNNSSYIYTRQDWITYFHKHMHIRQVPDLPYKGDQRPDDPFHWGSGPYAVLLGAKLSKGSTVEMLGFDLYSSDKKVNNIYKNTQNYSKTESRAVDPRYWIYQIAKVFESFPKVKFKIWIENDWDFPKAWNQPNVMVDTISNISYNS
jgi:hypothetical protein